MRWSAGEVLPGRQVHGGRAGRRRQCQQRQQCPQEPFRHMREPSGCRSEKTRPRSCRCRVLGRSGKPMATVGVCCRVSPSRTRGTSSRGSRKRAPVSLGRHRFSGNGRVTPRRLLRRRNSAQRSLPGGSARSRGPGSAEGSVPGEHSVGNERAEGFAPLRRTWGDILWRCYQGSGLVQLSSGKQRTLAQRFRGASAQRHSRLFVIHLLTFLLL